MNSSEKLTVTLLAEDRDFKITAFRSEYEFPEYRPQKPDISFHNFRKSNPYPHLVLISGNKNIVMAFNKLRFSPFDFLVKNQIDEQRRQSLLRKGMADKDLLLKNYRISVIHRALTAIGIPILLWLILEAFFK